MSKVCSVLEMDSLSCYGECVFVYRGTGFLSIIDGSGKKKVKCSFEAGQFINGNILLLCHDLPPLMSHGISWGVQVKKFEGITNDGYLIKSNDSNKNLTKIEYLSETHNLFPGTDVALRLNSLSIEFSKDEPDEVRFGIANCKLDDKNATEQSTESSTVILTQNDGNQIEISIKGLSDYKSRVARISSLRGINITCEFILKFVNHNSINELIDVINDICYILSVKNGTKIVWIYYEVMNRKGACILRKHSSNVTKPYLSLDIFYLNHECEIQTKDFLERAYPHYIINRDPLRLNRGVIDAYLDAKAERDYLETRGGKIAVAIEKLKYEYLKSKGRDAEFVIPKKDFQQFIDPIREGIVEILKNAKLENRNRSQSISDRKKIQGLNRRSFSNILKEFKTQFQLNFTNDEISLFIQSRNSLVHKGDFYCKTADEDESKNCLPLSSKKYEFFFLVNMFDRIFLKVLGYSDETIKIDWRNPPEKIVNWLN